MVGFVDTHAVATWAKAIIFVHVRFLSPCEIMLMYIVMHSATSHHSYTMNVCLSDNFPIMPFFSQHCSTKLTQLIHQYIFSFLSCKYILVGLPQHQCDRDDYHGYSLNLPNSQILKLMILSLHCANWSHPLHGAANHRSQRACFTHILCRKRKDGWVQIDGISCT